MQRLILLAFLASSLWSYAQVIPDYRTADWENAGYIGEFPEPSRVENVTDHGAVGDGITDDHAAVMAAIAALGGRAGVVYFPPGTYMISTTIELEDSVVLQGASSDSVFLHFDQGGVAKNCIDIESFPTDTFTRIAFDVPRGADTITLVNQVLSPGDFVEMRQDNGNWDIAPASWAKHSVGMITRVVDTVGNKAVLEDAAPTHFDTALHVEVRPFDPIVEAGIQCLTLARLDSPIGGGAYNILMAHAVNCFVDGVESQRSHGAHIAIEYSSHCTVSGTYQHEAWLYDGTSTRGYGTMIRQHANYILVQDNIYRQLRHSMMLKEGANRNVFAYNYSKDPLRVEIPQDGGADISMHGHYSFLNLWEGNDVQTLFIDIVWGPSGPFNAYFRNRLDLYGIIMSSGAVESDSQSFVGNEIPNTGTFKGNYILEGSGHKLYGNNHKGTIKPTGTGTLADPSYFIDEEPPYWGNEPWPAIGPPHSLREYNIPAKERYAGGGAKTTCGVEADTSTSLENHDTGTIQIYPNPTRGKFVMDGIRKSDAITVYTILGTSVPYKRHGNMFEVATSGLLLIKIDAPDRLSSVVYRLSSIAR